MPDPMLFLKAVAAAMVLLLSGWPPRMLRPAPTSAGWVLGVGAGFFVGCWILGLQPHWPPREDLDRLLLILFPTLIAIELLASIPRIFAWLIWLLRLGLAAAAARVLLHNTIYLKELAGLGS